MEIITVFSTTQPPAEIEDQIAQLVFDNTTDLFLRGAIRKNLLFPAFQTALALEVGQYNAAIGKHPDRRVELVVATDGENPERVVGFLQYLPLIGADDACGVTYMVVRKECRRQGIARAMIDAMLERFPHAELSCFVDKVPVYEALGFQVVGLYETQVRLCTRSQSAQGVMATLNTQQIFESQPVADVMRRQFQTFGPREMKKAGKESNRLTDSLKQKANNFFKLWQRRSA